MIIKTKEFQNACKLILDAVDGDTKVKIVGAESLEVVANGNILYLNVTNKEYYASVSLKLDGEEHFRAVVSAKSFLALVSKMTTPTLELTTENNTLVVKGNGTYKLPMIYDIDHLAELTKIEITNPIKEFFIPSETLLSIVNFNGKELLKGSAKSPLQNLYFVDEKGCVTFRQGGCVNSFNLSEPVRLLLTDKLVKLFKLFKGGDVKFTLGYDALSNGTTQQKVRFDNGLVNITSILVNDENMLNKFPSNAIRERAFKNLVHGVNISKDMLIQALDRLLIFNNIVDPKFGNLFEFGVDSVTIYDSTKANSEVVPYSNSSLMIEEPFRLGVDLDELKITLDGCSEEFVNLQFGDTANKPALTITRGNAITLIPIKEF